MFLEWITPGELFKDKDKDKDAFIDPLEFALHLMMAYYKTNW